ncbi:hypothetical protein CF327_g7077 [Tilletia walkeri]|nr:hypothetical protein CF327_g7077 [Tilletia walkeri]
MASHISVCSKPCRAGVDEPNQWAEEEVFPNPSLDALAKSGPSVAPVAAVNAATADNDEPLPAPNLRPSFRRLFAPVAVMIFGIMNSFILVSSWTLYGDIRLQLEHEADARQTSELCGSSLLHVAPPTLRFPIFLNMVGRAFHQVMLNFGINTTTTFFATYLALLVYVFQP